MRHVLTIEPTVALAQDPRNSEKKVLCCAQCFIDCPAACIVGITDHLTRNKVLFVHRLSAVVLVSPIGRTVPTCW